MQSHHLLSSLFIFFLFWLTSILARNELRNGSELGPYNYGNGERGARIFKVNGDGHGNGNNNWRPQNPTTPRPPANPPNIVPPPTYEQATAGRPPPPSYEETMERRRQQQINLPFQHDRVHLQGHLPQGYNRPMPVFPPNEQQLLQSLVDQSKEQSRLGVDAIGVSDFEQWMGRPLPGAHQPSRSRSQSSTPSQEELPLSKKLGRPKGINSAKVLRDIVYQDQPIKGRRERPLPQTREQQKEQLEFFLRRNPEFEKELNRHRAEGSALISSNLDDVWNDDLIQGIRGLHQYGGVSSRVLGEHLGRRLEFNTRYRYDYELNRRGVELFNEATRNRRLAVSNYEHVRNELEGQLDRLGRGESPLPPPIAARTLGGLDTDPQEEGPSRSRSHSSSSDGLNAPQSQQARSPSPTKVPKKRQRSLYKPGVDALRNIVHRDQPIEGRNQRQYPQTKEQQKEMFEHYLRRNPEFAKELDKNRAGGPPLTSTNLEEVWNDNLIQGIRDLHKYGGVGARVLGEQMGRKHLVHTRERLDYELNRRGVELYKENVGRNILPASNHEHMRRELDAHLDRWGRGESPLPPPIDARTLGEYGHGNRPIVSAEDLESAIAAVGKPDSRKRRKSPMRSDIVYDPNDPRESSSDRRSQGTLPRGLSPVNPALARELHMRDLAEKERKRLGQETSSNIHDVPGTSSQMYRNQQQQGGSSGAGTSSQMYGQQGGSSGAGTSQQQQQASTSQHHRSRGSAGLNAPQQQQARSPLPPKVPTKSPSPKRKRPRSPPKRQKREAQFG